MTIQHTLGPWWRDDDGFIAAGNGESYVTVADPNCSDDLDEREANANLIAAAPQIFDALELCEAALAELSRLDDGTCSTSALIAAREALAKARPRTG
jgi:hypothetical protein